MECRLLFSNYKNEATMSLVQEVVGGTAGNNVAHRADAFELALRAALGPKNYDPTTEMMGTIMLQCRFLDCQGHDDYIPYSFTVSSRGICPRCKGFRMQCVGCGYTRREQNSWRESGRGYSCNLVLYLSASNNFLDLLGVGISREHLTTSQQHFTRSTSHRRPECTISLSRTTGLEFI